jgi:hypothetical protein
VASTGLEVASKWSRSVEIEALLIFALTQKRTSGTLFRLYAIPPQRLATLALRGYLQKCPSRGIPFGMHSLCFDTPAELSLLCLSCANTNAYLRHAFQTLCHTPAETRYARSTGLPTDMPLSGHPMSPHLIVGTMRQMRCSPCRIGV